jgi:hypothetical protein
MDLPNVKELERLLKMCRKQGIVECSLLGMAFKFGDLPRDDGTVAEDAAPTELTDEQAMYYSSMPGANEQ